MSDQFAQTLLEASYEGIAFPVGRCVTTGGHDFADHTAYLQRGADSEHTGEAAYRGSMVAFLVNGLTGYGNALYPQRYRQLIAKLAEVPIGRLVHPTHGLLTAAMRVWKVTADPEARSGFEVEIEWSEQNGSVADAAMVVTVVNASADRAASLADQSDATLAQLGIQP